MELGGWADRDLLGSEEDIERRIPGHTKECQHGSEYGDPVGEQGPVLPATLLGGNDLGDRKRIVLDDDGDDRQRKRHFICSHLRQATGDADGAVGVATLTGAERHTQLAEEHEVDHQEKIACHAEVGEHLTAVYHRDKCQRTDAASQAEHGAEIEHDAVAYRGPLENVFQDVDEGLPIGDTDAALYLGDETVYECRHQQAVKSHDQQCQRKVSCLVQPEANRIEVHSVKPPLNRNMATKYMMTNSA